MILVLTDYPNTWTTNRLKYLFNYTLSSVDRHVHLEELPVDVCHYPDVYHNEKIRFSDPLPRGTCTEEEFLKFSLRDGDILITKDSESPDDIGVPCLISGNRSNTVCGYHLGIIRSRTYVDPGYFFRFLQTDLVKWYFYGESSGITRYGLGKPSVENLELPVPPLEEQKIISRYLDKKTKQIDSLIENIQKKIELLKEQRTSLINQCVTKGLDPNVEMKDSGVEWIGEIPKYWTIVKIGHYSKIIRGSSPRPSGDPSLFGGSLIPWITVGEVTNQKTKYILSTQNFLTEEGSRQSTTGVPGTLLLSNSGATLGVPRFTNIEGCINDGSVAFLNIRSTLLPDFLYWFLTTQTVRLLKQQSGFGQPNLNTEIVSNLKITLPTLEEQREIVSEIETTVGKTNSIVEIESRRLELFTEYRQSLISSVVTGKVRVTEDMI